MFIGKKCAAYEVNQCEECRACFRSLWFNFIICELAFYLLDTFLSLPPSISHSLFLHSFVFETHFTRTNVLLCCYDPRLCLAKQTASYFNAMFEFITWKIACNLRLVYRFRIPSSLRVAFELADWLTTKKKKATRKRVGRKMGELLSRVWESESVLCHFKCQPFCAYAYADI